MFALQRLGSYAAVLLMMGWLAGSGGEARGQIPRRGGKVNLPNQEASPLVGKWQAVAKDGSKTDLDVQAQDGRLTVELVLTDAAGKVSKSGRAEKVLAIGPVANTGIKLEPARQGSMPKAFLKFEEGKLRLQVIDGIDRMTAILTKLDDAGKPVEKPIEKVESGNTDFTEVASFKCGLKLSQAGLAAISADGKLVAAAAADVQHQIAIYDVSTGEEQRRLDLVGPITCVRWSADGQTLVAGSGTRDELLQQGEGRQVGLWNTADWTQRALVEHHEHPISITLSRDASVMAVAGFVDSGQAGTLTIWNTLTKAQTYSERKNQSRTNMAMSPKGDFLVASPFGGEAQIMLFDLPSGKQQPGLWKIKEPLDRIAITPDGRGLAGVGRKGDVYLFDLRGRKQTKTFPGYPGRAHCALLIDGAKYLALGGHKEGVQIFETRTGKLAHRFLPCEPPSVYHLAASADSSLLLTYGQDRTVRIWKTPFGAAAAE